MAHGMWKATVGIWKQIKHATYPLALKDEIGRKHIERIINTAGYNYWLACDECLKVCPLNKNK